MEMRLRTPVTRGYFFLLGALRLVNAASPRTISVHKKKISSGTQGKFAPEYRPFCFTTKQFPQYVLFKPDPGAVAVDAFSLTYVIFKSTLFLHSV